MASDSDRDRDAAAFFAHIFRATISADNISEESQIFHPIIVGLLSGSIYNDERSASDRILLVHPISRRVAVLRGDPSLLADLLSAGAGRKEPPPASKASIEAMPIVEMVDSEECSVCLEEFGQAVVKEMPCEHRFHGDCIDKWLGLHGTCPVCRYCMPAEESGSKKVGGEGDGDGQGGERAVWFEITFGRGRSGDRDGDREQEQQVGDQIVDSSSV